MKMKEVKAIIFDLDNTLYDTGNLTEIALVRAVKAMIKKGLNCSFKEGLEKIKQVLKENPSKDKFEELAKFFGPYKQEIIKKGKNVYYNVEFDKLNPYPDTKKTLEQLKKNYKLVLITFGNKKQQNKKIDVLGIRDYFDYIFIDEENNKEEQFLKTLKVLKLKPENIVVVGDRIDNEIKIANKLGMRTVRLKKGRYKELKHTSRDERPNYTIGDLRSILEVIIKNNKKKPKIVAIGGGTGLPTIAEGLRKYTEDLTMIVTVTDSGRSSGILRKELNVLPPGDIRNCLIALSNSEKLMCDLFRYRFDNGSLQGHSFGNFFIVALTKLTGSFEKGIEKASEILKLKGKVLPSTFDNVHICALLEDGTVIEEENNIIDRHNEEVHLRSPIKKVFLKPEAKANEKALEEIKKADIIVLCPGSLFTSIISNLLIQGVSEAIRESRAKKVYICNIMTQQCQTYGYKASDHIRQIIKYLRQAPDYVVLNSKKPEKKLLELYRVENTELVENDFEKIKKLGVKIISNGLLEDSPEKKILWEKKDLLRHDSDKTAKIIKKILMNELCKQ